MQTTYINNNIFFGFRLLMEEGRFLLIHVPMALGLICISPHGQLRTQIRHERCLVLYVVYHLADISKTSPPLGVLFRAMAPSALFFRHNAFKNSGLSMLADVCLNILHRVSKTITDQICHFSSCSSHHACFFAITHSNNSDYVSLLPNIALFCTTDNVTAQP